MVTFFSKHMNWRILLLLLMPAGDSVHFFFDIIKFCIRILKYSSLWSYSTRKQRNLHVSALVVACLSIRDRTDMIIYEYILGDPSTQNRECVCCVCECMCVVYMCVCVWVCVCVCVLFHTRKRALYNKQQSKIFHPMFSGYVLVWYDFGLFVDRHINTLRVISSQNLICL